LFKSVGLVDTEDVRFFLKYGVFLWKKRDDLSGAEVMLRRARDLYPRVGSFQYAKFLHEAVCNVDAAKEMYEKSIELNPGDKGVLEQYAEFLVAHTDHLDAAISAYDQIIKIDENDEVTIANFAALLLMRGFESDLERALYLCGTIIDKVNGEVNQPRAEAAFYLVLCAELKEEFDISRLLPLRKCLSANYVRGAWDFTPLLDRLLPKVIERRRKFYLAISAAILDGNLVSSLSEFDEWSGLDSIVIESDALKSELP
jgi:hypothetical protein